MLPVTPFRVWAALEGRRHIPLFQSISKFTQVFILKQHSQELHIHFPVSHKPSQGNLVIRPIGFKYPLKSSIFLCFLSIYEIVQSLVHPFRLYGFGKVGIHPCRLALFYIIIKCIGCHGNNGYGS